MTHEENWQIKLSSIAERTKFIFNNELLSDVKFVVASSTDEGESKKVIPQVCARSEQSSVLCHVLWSNGGH